MNEKFLSTDRTFLDAAQHNEPAMEQDAARAHTAYDTSQSLTAKYNSLEDGKWDGIMSAAPRERHVFEMPKLAADADANAPLPASWGAGDQACQQGVVTAAIPSVSLFAEQHCTVSINAAHFARSSNGNLIARWNVIADLGISGSSVVYGSPGRMNVLGPIMTLLPQNPSPWLEYDFTTTTAGPATLALHLLPTFPVDSGRRLRYAVELDGGAAMERDAAGGSGSKAADAGDGPSGADWPQNVLRNSAIDSIPLGTLTPGKHIVRLLYRDPGVVFEHLVITFPGAPPAYPVPPETK